MIENMGMGVAPIPMYIFYKMITFERNHILYSIKIKEQTRKLAEGCTQVRQGEADVV